MNNRTKLQHDWNDYILGICENSLEVLKDRADRRNFQPLCSSQSRGRVKLENKNRRNGPVVVLYEGRRNVSVFVCMSKKSEN
jgi:hypothetical protein